METPLVINPALEKTFLAGWESGRVLFLSAPCGCGKTAAARALLQKRRTWTVDAQSTALALTEVPPACEAVVVDNLHCLTEPEQQQALSDLIRTREDLHFVLLGRGRAPGFLMPFQFDGTMLTIETALLNFDRATSLRMLESRGIPVEPKEMDAIQRDIKGYPAAMEFLCRRMKDGTPYSAGMLEKVREDLFRYYDEAVYHRFEPALQYLLLDLAPFESFHLELARMVSGNPRAGELLGHIQQDSTMLLFDGLDTYRFWPIFRDFLLWRTRRTLTDEEIRRLYSRGGLYYELHGEPGRALECYAAAEEQNRISELLVKNAELHPGVGHYREMQDYYFSLPREEILRSPSLMCGMSMLTAMCLDYEASEEWYRELRSYGARLGRGDPELRTVQGRLAYLDIALPQRGSRGMVEVIAGVFRVMTDRKLPVPSFSVTSTLPSIMNGGKDFCEWSKQDELLYATMRRPVETVLGRDGVGLADCAICESKFEKGADVSARLLTLMSRLGEIQARGTPDIEFALTGLLARVQVSEGRAAAALESVKNLRERFREAGELRFLPNIDAMLCRIHLYLGDLAEAGNWMREKAPGSGGRLWAMWRYQYFTKAMVQITDGECAAALALLEQLRPYCEQCGRVMDGIYLRTLSALCRCRLNDGSWREELGGALESSREYRFIRPIAQYGAALLPLLQECGWEGDAEFLGEVTAAARAQAVLYPRLLHQQLQPLAQLSAAEAEVLRLVCEDLSNQEIGEILEIRLPTVKTHVSRILRKLGVSRRSEARAAAEKLHLL